MTAWTALQIQTLQNNNGQLTARELGYQLRRSVDSVNRGFVRYGGTPRRIQTHGDAHPWSDKQVALLMERAATTPPSKLAPLLGLPISAILTKLRVLGIPYAKAKRAWTRADVHELLELAEKYGQKEIAKRVKRNIGSVNAKMQALGLHAFHGSYSMRGAEKATGYHHQQLMRARDALGQKWHKRVWRNRGRFVLTETQLDELCEWLKTETWPSQEAA